MDGHGAGDMHRKILAGVLAALLGATGAAASDLTILSGGAAKAGIQAVIPAFEASTGAKVKAEFAPIGRLTKALADGAGPDIVVVTEDVMPDVTAKGWIVAGTATEVGRVGIGLAVNQTAPNPEISTPEAFKATLLAAKSIVMIDPATGTSGKHLAKVFGDLGITEALKPKLTFLQGGYVVEPVGRGEIEIGLHQITEILPVKGIKLVGPLPAPLQKVTVYVASIGNAAKSPELARKFLDHLKSPTSRGDLLKVGFMGAN